MNDLDALSYRCLDCETRHTPAGIPTACPDCNGRLQAQYDQSTLAETHEEQFDLDQPTSPSALTRFASVLPFEKADIPSIGEGSTPLVDCPAILEESDATIYLKDEARNPTGSLRDREVALAVTAARAAGADTVALPTTGAGGHSAAAYAARAELDSEAFVPSRSPFQHKAMTNVYGGSMNVVGGRYPDAREAFEDASTDSTWFSLAPGETPFRREGAKTLAYELVESLGRAPEILIHPVGHGTALAGIYQGFRELESTGTIDVLPQLVAVQPDGCAPVFSAWDADESDVSPVDTPDTIVGSVEIPAPADGDQVLAAVRETGGNAIAVDDETALEAAVSASATGVPASATGGLAIAGLEALAEEGDVADEETVVLVDPAAATVEADILRSRLMSKGI